MPLWRLPNARDVVYTYAPFWAPAANARVQLNDVFMLFERRTFRRLAGGGPWRPVGRAEGARLCNFTGDARAHGTFECLLHAQAARRNLSLAWRAVGPHPRWVLHRRTSAARRAALARVRCRCAA